MIFNNKNLKSIHFVGVAGIGMSALADMLLSYGFEVSGSDKVSNPNIEKLAAKGLIFFHGHDERNVEDAELVVISSAISTVNPEVQRAEMLKIPVIKRGQMLAHLMLLKRGITVAGTHGKTTTTSFLSTILVENNYDPTILVGGIVANLQGNSRVGQGDYFVAEADESDGSFLALSPVCSVITNIDNDHLDYYQTFENLKKAFIEFANKIPFYGLLALNKEDDMLMSLLPKITSPYYTFGFSDAQYEARNLHFHEGGSDFDLYFLGEFKSKIEINLPGKHNVLNALGSIVIAHNLGIEFHHIAETIKLFKGVGRRLEKIFKRGNFEVIDDYAHHPTEIKTTLSTLKSITKKKLVAVFEPHRYTRTQKCWKDFLTAFDEADELYILPIYAASEAEIMGIDTTELVEQIKVNSEVVVSELDSLDELFHLVSRLQNQDVMLVTIGAGPISRKIREIVRQM